MDKNDPSGFTLAPQSFWLASEAKTDYPVLNQDLQVDLAIIGGGIAGILSAYWLSKEGLRLAIFEAGNVLHGTTGHTTAKITSQHGLIYNKLKKTVGKELAGQYADANEYAIKVYERIIEENNISCDFLHEDAYIYTLQDNYINKIQKEAETASSFGIKAHYLEETPLPFKVKAAVKFNHQAQFHPLKFLHPLTQDVINNGGRIFEHTRIVDIEGEGTYTLTTHNGNKITARKVIITTHYPFYNKPGFYFARIYQDRSYVVAVKTHEKYPGGMYINAESPTRSLRSQPSPEGELIFIGGENHKDGQGKNTNLHYEALIDFTHQTFSVKDIPYRWSTQDCTTLDSIPYIGLLKPLCSNRFSQVGND